MASGEATFAEVFFKSYREGRCYENTLTFVTEALSTSGGAQKFSVIKIENKGTSSFGLVNAERARSRLNGQLVAEEKNWYEHWVAVDERGMVYDFDFLITPSPKIFKDYVEEMFLDETECVTHSWTELCGGRENKLNDYWLTVFDATELLNGNKTVVWSGALAEALNDERNIPLMN